MANISSIKLPNGTTYNLKDNGALQLTGGTVTGPTIFENSVDIDEVTVGDLVATGAVTFTNNINAASYNGGQPTYTVKGTQTAATGSWTGNIDAPALYDGMRILYYLPYAGSGNATLNLTLSTGATTGAINCYYNTGRLTTHYGAGQNFHMTYWSAGSIKINGTATTDNRWIVDAQYYSDYTVSYSWTSAATAAKAFSANYFYSGSAKQWFHLCLIYGNTYAGAITFNINGQGAKPVYINGSASSSSNYSLPAGWYTVYWDGTNFYVRTDGKITGDITGNAATATNVAWSGVTSKPTATGSGTTGISIAAHGTGTVIGVQSTTTTASKVTVGSHSTDYGVKAAGSASTWTFEEKTIPNVTSAGSASSWTFEEKTIPNVTAAGSGSASLTFAMDTTDTKKLKITFSHTHTAPTLGTAIKVQSKSGGSNGTAPTLGTAIKVQSKSGGANSTAPTLGSKVPTVSASDVTVPIKNASASTFVTGTTHTVTDNGHTHSIG